MAGGGVGFGERISATKAFADVSAIIKAMPDRFGAALLPELRSFAPQLLARMRAGVPIRKGKPPSRAEKWRHPGGLKSLLTTQIDDKALRLKGGLLTHQARSDGFYGFILDAGRGIKRTRSKPGTRKINGSTGKGKYGGALYSKRYSRAISLILPTTYDITFGRVQAWAREQLGPMLIRAYDRSLIAAIWSGR